MTTQRLKPATGGAIIRKSSPNVNAATLAKVGCAVAEVEAERGKRLPGKPLVVPKRPVARSGLKLS